MKDKKRNIFNNINIVEQIVDFFSSVQESYKRIIESKNPFQAFIETILELLQDTTYKSGTIFLIIFLPFLMFLILLMELIDKAKQILKFLWEVILVLICEEIAFYCRISKKIAADLWDTLKDITAKGWERFLYLAVKVFLNKNENYKSYYKEIHILLVNFIKFFALSLLVTSLAILMSILILIFPIVAFISKKYIRKLFNKNEIEVDETDFDSETNKIIITLLILIILNCTLILYYKDNVMTLMTYSNVLFKKIVVQQIQPSSRNQFFTTKSKPSTIISTPSTITPSTVESKITIASKLDFNNYMEDTISSDAQKRKGSVKRLIGVLDDIDHLTILEYYIYHLPVLISENKEDAIYNAILVMSRLSSYSLICYKKEIKSIKDVLLNEPDKWMKTLTIYKNIENKIW
ncbi:membrane hypothetical protein [Candidatus Magnetomoraceae bacterium gMMP-1]